MVRQMKLTPRGGVEAYPLSPMQQGMLFHRAQGGVPGVDIEQVICELPAPVQAEAFEQAWREVVARHPVLRTGFEWGDAGEPRQIVEPATDVRFGLQVMDFAGEHEARLGLEEYLQADRRNGFAELNPPLVRVALLRGGSGKVWFVTTYHHLVLDARSMTLMFREALDWYDAQLQGRRLELPAARPYRAYIDWLQTLHTPRAEKFWREQLAGFTSPTVLPIARTAEEGADEQVGAGELAFRLAPELMTKLRAVAAKHEVTVNTLVQAAWALVLTHYSGEDDVVFGALRACRKIPVEGAQSTLGLFINTVPVRVRTSTEAAVGSWLRELRAQWVTLRDYEHTPLMQVQQWSGAAPGRPLFETLVSYQEPAWDAALQALGGAWSQRVFDIRAQPGYAVALEVLGGSALIVKLIYDRTRFAAGPIARLAAHYRVALEALASDTFSTVGSVPILDAREHRQLLEWNRTSADYPRNVCVHTWVEQRADEMPGRIAVTDSANALTYGELNARANRLAHRLSALGLGPEKVVAVCMECSTEMIVAWLGVLKAGCAFVPLDPAYPNERLAFQIDDCGARVILTQPRLRPSLPALPPFTTTIEVAADGSGFQGMADSNPAVAVGARHLAYVIYTSGSTGQPKGVEVEHRSLMNLVTWHQQTYRVQPADRATHLASPAFDASVWEIWPYLAAGSSVHIPDEETRLSPSQLWRWLSEKKVTISFMPTPLAEAALSEPWPHEMALRALLTGGDRLKRRPPANFPCALINHYGPTECTVVATCIPVDMQVGRAGMPTIGRPIANTQAYVLDRHRRLAPVGVVGELYLGGESLARGYRNRSALTAQKFVANPFADSGEATRVLYRTGDLVRWTSEGELEFVGRVDGQVKIRGCRIELAEIESTLQGHALVRESLVLARPDERGQLQLVAYVLPQDAAAGSVELEVTDYLRAKLPSYMVPAAIVTLPAWPLTTNGKIDRNALPAPASRAGGDSRVPFAAPATAVEQTIAKIWCDVLQQETVGLGDSFFDLGGHSLLAAQVVSRVNAALQTGVSVRALFDQPTLAGFAREVELRREQNPASCIPLQRLKRRTARPELELVQPS